MSDARPLGAAARGGRWHDLGTRAVSGVALVALAAGTARAGGVAFLLTWLVAAGCAHWEWQRLIGAPRLVWRVILGTLALAACAALAGRAAADGRLWIAAVLPILVAALVAAVLAGPGRRAWAAAGVGYAGAMVLALVGLRFSPQSGARAIFWLFATVWSTDVFAYFGGRLIGGPKLWPRVSPSKTWSGTLTGVAVAGLLGTAAALFHLAPPTLLAPVFALTVATAAVSQAGDAFESAVKRRFGVKDSSRLIPGHGGVLDRLDGFIAAAVFAFAVGALRDPPSAAGGLFSWA